MKLGVATGAFVTGAACVVAGGFSLSTRQLQQQMMSGAGPEGRAMRMMTMGPADRPANANPPPPASRVPGAGVPGLDAPLEASGPPTLLDGYLFEYHVNNEHVPARTASINLPRPQQRAAQQR